MVKLLISLPHPPLHSQMDLYLRRPLKEPESDGLVFYNYSVLPLRIPILITSVLGPLGKIRFSQCLSSSRPRAGSAPQPLSRIGLFEKPYPHLRSVPPYDGQCGESKVHLTEIKKGILHWTLAPNGASYAGIVLNQ